MMMVDIAYVILYLLIAITLFNIVAAVMLALAFFRVLGVLKKLAISHRELRETVSGCRTNLVYSTQEIHEAIGELTVLLSQIAARRFHDEDH